VSKARFSVASRTELLYGVHPIIECLKAKKRKILSFYTTKPFPKAWKRIKPYLPSRLPNVQHVSREALTRLAGSPDHMGIVAAVSPFKYATNLKKASEKPRLLLLDGVQDVGNLGAILRSAYCTNIDGVVLCRKRGALLTPAVFKASAGLAEHLPIYLVDSLPQAVRELKELGYHMYMAVAQDGDDASDVAFKLPHCLVIGSEEKGIDEKIRGMGHRVTLPQRDTSSYNASVAAGIFLFLSAYGR